MALPVHLRALAPLALLATLGACVEGAPSPVPPLDRFYFPMGMGVTRLDGGSTALLVASSNYDLRYSGSEGGTLLSVDPLASAAYAPLALRDGERIASYAGPLAVVDTTTCPGSTPGAVVASRLGDVTYRFAIDSASGALTCTDCALDAPGGFDDPFAVAVACGPAGNRAYVAYLDPPDATRGFGPGAWITEIDLDGIEPPREIELGDGPVRAMAYDRRADRLWATTLSEGGRALLHSAVLSDLRWSGASPWEAVDTVDLFPLIRGAELRAIAVGTSPAPGVTRLFLTVRLYDAESQDSTGTRPFGDVGGVLIALDAADVGVGADRRLEVSIRAVEPLGMGVGEVAVVRRPAGADLVVATASDEDVLVVYDDGAGEFLHFVARDPSSGGPILGDRPLGLAVDQPLTGAAEVYVAGFGSHLVTRFPLDPATPSAPLVLSVIGGLAP
jgi:hypothetical protein